MPHTANRNPHTPNANAYPNTNPNPTYPHNSYPWCVLAGAAASADGKPRKNPENVAPSDMHLDETYVKIRVCQSLPEICTPTIYLTVRPFAYTSIPFLPLSAGLPDPSSACTRRKFSRGALLKPCRGSGVYVYRKGYGAQVGQGIGARAHRPKLGSSPRHGRA